MIYTEEDYESPCGKYSDFDIGKVAVHIDIEIRKDPLIKYEGYSVDFKHGLIRFYIKTGDGDEYIVFDPCTLSFHIQNDLWISEFNETSIFRLLVILSEIRYKWNIKAMKDRGSNEKGLRTEHEND